ncbi:hypothetical protein LC087_17995 [Bacillus carboniphilus]|uniref:Uncharacterized protein n=1 Tax=Bacillus carboniphilus TaxID=86663 RepID=A0ABY9JT89_9BACI|nr:hypothetical protein [Bacillus carboniphilus]WLR42552.1 hypothetical protein LC087_17995 [Bacillus carboniphilus]
MLTVVLVILPIITILVFIIYYLPILDKDNKKVMDQNKLIIQLLKEVQKNQKNE